MEILRPRAGISCAFRGGDTVTGPEVYQDDAGEWRWRIRAANGEIIADSAEGYVNRADAEHGLALVVAIEADTE